MEVTMMTRQEVAAFFRVHPRTILMWVKAGKVPKPMRLGRRLLWDEAKIRAIAR